ncbi:hypothetical protein [Streptomyces sp. NBC_00582]|uniref:hypothetical protein n=1 Tax=Streptomyces sp. NBC_00582 TaxID=2975783 RepID=UPI0010D43FD1|nr:hypothetical protein [Streptomyces sp. NBC_00582]WUB60150.1 hypothetical protein OG852_06990 [Streptomyces sp. NBC_00582]
MQDARVRSVAAVSLWAVTLTVLLPGLILQSHGAHPSPALALQGVVVVHSGGALAGVLTASRVRFVALGFWVFVYIWLGLAGLAMLASDTYPWPYRTGETTALGAVALVELGLLAHSAGTALAARRERARGHNAPPGILERVLARRIAPWRLLALCGLALGLAAVLIAGQPGRLGAYFTSRQAITEAGGEDASLRSLLSWSLSVPAFWALLGLLRVPRRPDGDRWLRAVRWLLLPVLLALNVVVNNPISKPRFWAGMVLLTLLFSVPRLCRPRAFRVTAAAILGALLFVFPYSDYFRYNDRETLTVASLAEQFTSNGDYDAFQQMQSGVDYAHDHGFSPQNVLGPPLFMVPRAMWPEKPKDTGITLAEYAGYEFHNLSAPLWIESYLWAGPLAVVLVFLLLGAFGRRVDDVRHRLRENPGALAALLVPAFAFYQMVFLRGSLLAIAGPLTLLLAVPLLITSPNARASRFRSSAMPAASPRHASIPGTGGHP